MTRKHDKTKKHEDSEPKAPDAQKPEDTAEELLMQKAELLGQLQRVSADYANFQKRVPKQIADSVAYQMERFIRSLLPVLDSLEHTLLNVGSAEDVGVLVKGIQITHDQMLDILKSHEVEQIHADGEMFDPARHEAMMRRSEPGEAENIVLEEFQKGYMLNGRVIRPSKVIVNKFEEEESQRADEQSGRANGQSDQADEQSGRDEAADECDENDTE